MSETDIISWNFVFGNQEWYTVSNISNVAASSDTKLLQMNSVSHNTFIKVPVVMGDTKEKKNGWKNTRK